MNPMLDRIDCIISFVRVVERGSFSAVAKERGSTQPTISKQINALEEYLDVQLFLRSTRRVNLTPEGQQFYLHCLNLLEVFSQAESSVGKRQEPAGALRVNCSTAFGQQIIIPILQRFLVKYPAISVNLTMADYYINLVEEGIDLAIRVGNFQSSNLKSKAVGKTRLVAVASPAYLAKFGKPSHPSELSNHNCIVYTRQSTANEWHFRSNQMDLVILVNGNLQVNDSAALRQVALAGIGIVTSPLWVFQSDLQQQNLEIILEEFEPLPLPIQVIYRRTAFLSLKVNCFIEFLTEELK